MWETRLNPLKVLLDEYMDVQRRWVYLDGIFGNEESDIILSLLKAESSSVLCFECHLISKSA